MQTFSYNSVNNILKITVPAHNQYNTTKFLLDGSQVQMESLMYNIFLLFLIQKKSVMKSEGLCFVSNLEDLDVEKMAESMLKESSLTDFTLEMKHHKIKIRKSKIGSSQKPKFSPEVVEFCKDAQMIYSQEETVDQATFKALNEGKVVLIDDSPTSGCTLRVKY